MIIEGVRDPEKIIGPRPRTTLPPTKAENSKLEIVSRNELRSSSKIQVKVSLRLIVVLQSPT